MTDLVGRRVVDGRVHGVVVEDIQLFAAVSPRDELNVAVLRVEREILDVECAVGFDQSRIHPQHRTVIRYDRVRHHIVIKLVTGTTTSNTVLTSRDIAITTEYSKLREISRTTLSCPECYTHSSRLLSITNK